MRKFHKKSTIIAFFLLIGSDLFAEGGIKAFDSMLVLAIFLGLLGINLIPILIYFLRKDRSRTSISLWVFSVLTIFINVFSIFTTSLSNVQTGTLIALSCLDFFFLLFDKKKKK